MDVCLLGEGMIELSNSQEGWRLAHGGDVLNMAIHLARLGRHVGFITAVGPDPFSATLRRDWAAEGLDENLILTNPSRLPGLYAIRTDPAGERSFFYWRSDSAARALFELPEIGRVLAAAEQAPLFCYSLITLAILPEAARARLFDLCRRIRRRGGRVAFDGNYRPGLWDSVEQARVVQDEALFCCDVGLPTLGDEQALRGAIDAAAVSARWRAFGVSEVIVKAGARGCAVDCDTWVLPPSTAVPADTSGAGDAFNAAYLHARMAGRSPTQAAHAGHRLATWVISRVGAIPAHDDAAPYRLLNSGDAAP
jgi:2-dehydro-3-deoxygluconokinase